MTTTRFAPSPTGWLHIGNLRAALFNYCLARQGGGTFVLRIDDTDQERSEDRYIEGIKTDLEWLGFSWDRIESQSKRLDRYAEAKAQLVNTGRLYECFETPVELDLKRKKQLNMGKPPVYDRSALGLSDSEKDELRKTRQPHWRFKLDLERIEWTDGIMGPISIDAASVSDPVLIKESGQILYTLASVVDDVDMGITHVVRGSDHVTNTATQIQIIRALGGEIPSFSHHSLLTGPQGEALSKRLGTLALRDLREQGIHPMAILSLMSRLGSSEPVVLRDSIDDIVPNFDIGTFGTAPTKLDAEDLKPLTSRIIGAMTYEQVKDALDDIGVTHDVGEVFWQTIRGNLNRVEDAAAWWDVVKNGAVPMVDDEDTEFVVEAFENLGMPPYSQTAWSEWTSGLKSSTGRKGRGLFMPLRKAVTGQASGPEMADLMLLLQKKPGLRKS